MTDPLAPLVALVEQWRAEHEIRVNDGGFDYQYFWEYKECADQLAALLPRLRESAESSSADVEDARVSSTEKAKNPAHRYPGYVVGEYEEGSEASLPRLREQEEEIMSKECSTIRTNEDVRLLRERIEQTIRAAVDRMAKYDGDRYIHVGDFLDDALIYALDDAVATEPVLRAEQALLDECAELRKLAGGSAPRLPRRKRSDVRL